jgi:uncharacterized protein YceH (UPF0502 family)
VTRYRQVLEERLGLGDQQLALVAVLLLRGPQTAGELRARTERMASFAGISSLEGELSRLATWPEPLVARQTRRPGQKEERWIQLLMDVPDEAPAAQTDGTEASESGPVPVGPAGPALPGPAPSSAGEPRPERAERADLRQEVAELRGEVAELRGEVAELRSEVADLRGEVIDLRAAHEHLEAQLGGA